MKNLPARLEDLAATARLPEQYERAKIAIAQCERIDECKQWANRMEAVCSYARQARDKTLLTAAVRIKLRAEQRYGQLLQEIEAQPGKRTDYEPGGSAPTRSEVARAAGVSKDQQVRAIRIANVPQKKFERMIESETPPTVTALAKEGMKHKPKPFHGLDPKDFAASTEVQGDIDSLAKLISRIEPAVVVRGTRPHEYKSILNCISTIIPWLQEIVDLIRRQNDAQ